jgi:hypothetical protein
VTRPFEFEFATTPESLVEVKKAALVEVLRRVVADLDKLERSVIQGDSEAVRLAAASRAIHLALVELQPSV